MFSFDIPAIDRNCAAFYGLYNATGGNVRDMCERKIRHTSEVAKNCRLIAEKKGICGYDCDMAWVIGMLHDFARFGQAVRTHSFVDSVQFDHAKLGARLLFTHHLVEDIVPGFDGMCDEDKAVMEKAVLHHSDFELPDDLSAREEMFCVILRDADKLDIFRTVVESGPEKVYGCSMEELLRGDISPRIEAAFYGHRPALYSDRVTKADYLMAHIALYFGLKEESSRQRAAEQGYLARLMDVRFADPAVEKRYLAMRQHIKI